MFPDVPLFILKRLTGARFGGPCNVCDRSVSGFSTSAPSTFGAGKFSVVRGLPCAL